jgi:cytochrome b
VLIATLHPAAPAHTPHGSIAVWLLVAVLLALVVTSGMVLASRR